MTMPSEESRRYTLDEYFDLEAAWPEKKFEYRDGIVVDIRELQSMAGGSFRHVQISDNVLTFLRNRLKGSTCNAHGSDLRVQIPLKTLYAYPDITVVCGKPEVEHRKGVGDTLKNPKLIAEVLSPTTESYDRGTKFHRYFEIPSLEEYVLVSQAEPRIDVYLRRDDGSWLLTSYAGLTAVVRFTSIEIQIPLGEIYAGVEFGGDDAA